MPLFFEHRGEHYHLMVWHIVEPEHFFEQSLGFGSDKKHPKRRLEHLSGRFLLQQLQPTFPFEKMVVSALGKPELSDDSCHFSISHSYPYAAAIMSKDKSVGIDIQMYVPKIERLQTKFLTAEEQLLTANKIENITLAWAAKEALFKYYGLGSVDFKADMPIEKIEWEQNKARISMQLSKTREACTLHGWVAAQFAMAWL